MVSTAGLLGILRLGKSGHASIGTAVARSATTFSIPDTDFGKPARYRNFISLFTEAVEESKVDYFDVFTPFAKKPGPDITAIRFRTFAALGLRAYGKTGLERVIELSKTKSREKRMAAAQSLGKILTPASLNRLVKMSQDNFFEVRTFRRARLDPAFG